MFAVSNDAMEAQCPVRAGVTSVPEIQAVRNAFFAQETYRLRGCENKNLFDGREDTLFDVQSRSYCDMDLRVDGGCLRVDLGGIVDADTVEIISFDANEPTREVPPLPKPFANNIMAPYEKRPSKFVKKLTVTLPAYRSGSYPAVAIEGEHSTEGVYCAAETENGCGCCFPGYI